MCIHKSILNLFCMFQEKHTTPHQALKTVCGFDTFAFVFLQHGTLTISLIPILYCLAYTFLAK